MMIDTRHMIDCALMYSNSSLLTIVPSTLAKVFRSTPLHIYGTWEAEWTENQCLTKMQYFRHLKRKKSSFFTDSLDIVSLKKPR